MHMSAGGIFDGKPQSIPPRCDNIRVAKCQGSVYGMQNSNVHEQPAPVIDCRPVRTMKAKLLSRR
jgi:hypothetical protein